MNWKRTRFWGDMIIYNAENEYNKFEIRNWIIDESGQGKFQLCINGYTKGNFYLLREAKQFAENY